MPSRLAADSRRTASHADDGPTSVGVWETRPYGLSLRRREFDGLVVQHGFRTAAWRRTARAYAGVGQRDLLQRGEDHTMEDGESGLWEKTAAVAVRAYFSVA